MKIGDVCFHFELDITDDGNVACFTCGAPYCAVPSCTLLADYISEGQLTYCAEHILLVDDDELSDEGETYDIGKEEARKL